MLDRALFTLLNSHHSPFWDGAMMYVSRRESWFSAYALLILLLIHVYRKRAWLLVPLVAGSVWAADFISSEGFKPYIQRLRPCHEPALAHSIRLVEAYGCGGMWGFMSSHAANTMALTVFLALTLPTRFRLFVWVLFLWTLVTGFSRVYLGAHYPGDVGAGYALGALLGWGGAHLYRRADARWFPSVPKQ